MRDNKLHKPPKFAVLQVQHVVNQLHHKSGRSSNTTQDFESTFIVETKRDGIVAL